jgi:hypothetical protein
MTAYSERLPMQRIRSDWWLPTCCPTWKMIAWWWQIIVLHKHIMFLKERSTGMENYCIRNLMLSNDGWYFRCWFREQVWDVGLAWWLLLKGWEHEYLWVTSCTRSLRHDNEPRFRSSLPADASLSQGKALEIKYPIMLNIFMQIAQLCEQNLL